MSSNQPAKRRVAWIALLLMVAVRARAVAAQASSRVDLGGMVSVGGEEQRYLRVLQISGVTPLVPWSIQPFSPAQSTHLRDAKIHPWRARYDTLAGGHVHLLRPSVGLIENTTFPYQIAPGPTWAGRGLTAEGEVGIAASWGDFHAQFAPTAFAAQNASFPLAANGSTGAGQLNDARFPNNIDLPQRFGTTTYHRADFGNSMLALDSHGVFVGVASASQQWGPARDFPLVLGPNPGGFPNVFVGTSEPVDLWLFRLHLRAVYGRLGQSAQFQEVDSTRERLGSGVVFTALPRGLPGLELGAARFLHRPWTDGALSWSSLKRPFSGIISDNRSGNTLNEPFENQTGSVFARWAVPAAKAEFYTEFYKEDYPGPFHVAGQSLIEMPDDYSSFTVGFQRVLSDGKGAQIRVLHGEIVNGEFSHQGRGEGPGDMPVPPYLHSGELQGHTLNGLLLGSPDAYGGSGWRLGVDDFTPRGRRSITLERSLRLDWLPTLPDDQSQIEPDVIYALRFEVLRFMGSADYGVTIVPAIDLNRNLVAKKNVFNLAVGVTARGW